MIVAYLGNPISVLRQDLKISSYPRAVSEVVKTYAMAIHADKFEPVDWGEFNRCIIDGWGTKILIEIKTNAWRIYNQKFNQ